MKKLILPLLWFISIQVLGAAVAPEIRFQEGTNQLRQGKYEQAITTFKQLEQEGIHEAALYNNLGLAYFHTKQKGNAVVYFEKALLLTPLDAQITQNSKLAAVDSSPTQTGILAFIQENERALIQVGNLGTQASVVLLFMSSFIFLLVVLKKEITDQKRGRRISKAIVLSGTALFLVSYCVILILLQTADAIALKSMTGKIGPGSEARGIAELAEGEKLQIKNQFKGWYKVRTSNGIEAWVKANDIQVL